MSRRKELLAAIEGHQVAYEKGEPIISDEEFDALTEELALIDSEHMLTVGAPEGKVRHEHPCISLKKAKTYEQIDKWVRALPPKTWCVVEHKIDGMALVLTYIAGRLVRATTRGDGEVGRDVTDVAMNIQSIPNKIATRFPKIIVRGEVFITREDFADMPYSSARNTAVGLMKSGKQLDKLTFHAVGIMNDLGEDQRSHTWNRVRLSLLGFDIVQRAGGTDSARDIQTYLEHFIAERDTYPYEADGLVVKVEDLDLRQSMGATSHHPRWAIALKPPPTMASSVIVDIIEQTGDTGHITPIAIIEPVKINNSTVSRVTLHNRDVMAELGARVGATVIIKMAGDVIPIIERVIS